MATTHILKIKIKGKIITIQWEQYQEVTQNWDNHTLTCADPPRPELLNCMQKMSKHIVEICEFPETDVNKIEARSISISYGEEGSGLVISGVKDLENNASPMCINTPYKPEFAPDGMEHCAMSAELQDDLVELCEEGMRYINGDRAQQNLFEEQNATDVSAEDTSGPSAETGRDQAAGNIPPIIRTEQYSMPNMR